MKSITGNKVENIASTCEMTWFMDNDDDNNNSNHVRGIGNYPSSPTGSSESKS